MNNMKLLINGFWKDAVRVMPRTRVAFDRYKALFDANKIAWKITDYDSYKSIEPESEIGLPVWWVIPNATVDCISEAIERGYAWKAEDPGVLP